MTLRALSKRTVPSLAAFAALSLSPLDVLAQSAAAGPSPRSATVEKARGYGQCEIFLMKKQDGKLEALVYNTTGLNECPPAKFDPINAEKLAQETASDVAWKNPRRFWMMDRLTVALVGEAREFDGLPFNFVAKMEMPPGFTPGKGQAGFAFKPTKIQRVTKYEFTKGNMVFMLRSPDKHTWVMQTYTTHTDPTLTEAALPTLGKRLKLPKGWSFKATKLDKDLVINTNGLANIVPDNLENMYQGCINNVCNFDPWK
jgi:hypothetical protein